MPLWQRLVSLMQQQNKEALPPYTGKIEIFSRQCFFSSISQHKQRPDLFSRELCYRNLVETLDPSLANLTFFYDGARGPLERHFLHQEKRFPIVQIQEGTEGGSFLRLLDYVETLSLHPDTILYFVEDDYLHRPGWIEVLLEGFQIKEADYLTLYDHRDKYFFKEYEKLQSRLFATASCHWRTTPSTTQTFAVRLKTLRQHLAIHRRFSEGRKISADHQKFCLLHRLGATLLSAVPGFSTHLESEFLSPCFDWEKLLRSYLPTEAFSEKRTDG